MLSPAIQKHLPEPIRLSICTLNSMAADGSIELRSGNGDGSLFYFHAFQSPRNNFLFKMPGGALRSPCISMPQSLSLCPIERMH